MGKILVAVDFSDVTNRVLESAVTVARALGAEMVLLHAAVPDPAFVGYEAGPVSERRYRAHALRGMHRTLQELAKQCQDKGVTATALSVEGAAAEKIVEQARRLDATMVVVGSHGHGRLHHLLVGSVSEGVLMRIDRPVLVVPSKAA